MFYHLQAQMPNQDLSLLWTFAQPQVQQPAQQLYQQPVPQAYQGMPSQQFHNQVSNQYQNQVYWQPVYQQQPFQQVAPENPLNRFWPNWPLPVQQVPPQPTQQVNPQQTQLEQIAQTIAVQEEIKTPAMIAQEEKAKAEAEAQKGEEEIKKDLEEKQEIRKEEIKEEIKWKDQSYATAVLEDLLQENTKRSFEAQKAQKEKEYLIKKHEELMQKVNDMEYNRLEVDNNYKPLFRAINSFNKDQSKEAEKKLVSMLYDTIGSITWEDYRTQIQSYYNKSLETVNKMSQPITSGSEFVQPQQQYVPTWVVKTVWTKSRF